MNGAVRTDSSGVTADGHLSAVASVALAQFLFLLPGVADLHEHVRRTVGPDDDRVAADAHGPAKARYILASEHLTLGDGRRVIERLLRSRRLPRLLAASATAQRQRQQ